MNLGIVNNLPRVCILGSTGYLGLRLVNFLCNEGFDVVIVIRKNSRNKLTNLNCNYKVVHLEDAFFEEKLKSLKVNFLINAAVEYGKKEYTESKAIWTNLFYPLHVLSLLSEQNKEIVLISFDSFYSKFYKKSYKFMPAYVMSKHNFLEWSKVFLRGKSLSIVVLYLEHVVGPGESDTKFNSWFIKQCRQSQAVIDLSSGIQVRDFIFVDDILKAVQVVMEHTVPDGRLRTYEVGTGVGTTLKIFCEKVHNRLGSSAVLNFGALGLNDWEIMVSVAENSELLKLGWQPLFDINSIIEKTISEVF